MFLRHIKSIIGAFATVLFINIQPLFLTTLGATENDKFLTSLNASYDNVSRCINNNQCQNIIHKHEILASLLAALDKTGNEKYAMHIMASKEIEAMSNKDIITYYVINTLSKHHKSISTDLAELILQNLQITNLDMQVMYRFFTLLPSNFESQSSKIAYIVPRVWVHGNFPSKQDEIMFFIKYQKYFSLDTFNARIDKRLLSGNITEAERINDLFKENSKSRQVNANKIKLAKLCRQNPDSVLEYLNSIKLDPSYNIVVLKCLIDSKRYLHVAQFASKLTKENIDFFSDAIWKYQNLAFIDTFKTKQYSLARQILLANQPKNRADYIHHQWLLGWLHMNFLDAPQHAIPYFNNILKNSSFAISVSRANYWIARTYDKLGDSNKAAEYYKLAADYPTTFYGQEAIQKLRFDLPEVIAKHSVKYKQDNFDNDWFKVGLVLVKLKLNTLGTQIIQDVMHNKNKQDIYQALYYSNIILDNASLMPIVRYANRFGIFISKTSYPKIHNDLNNFASAIIRQESGSIVDAVSNKGALGVMQVMPASAKIIATKLGMKYDNRRMLSDQDYNIKIGQTFLNNMLEKFNNNKYLAAAAYNAGPNPVKRWINEFGTPYNMQHDDFINWIESITYSETRNYVMRVIENYRIYEALYKQ